MGRRHKGKMWSYCATQGGARVAEAGNMEKGGVLEEHEPRKRWSPCLTCCSKQQERDREMGREGEKEREGER